MNNERKLKGLLVDEIKLTNELLEFIESAFEAVCEDKKVLHAMKWKFEENLEMISYNGCLSGDFKSLQEESIKHVKDVAIARDKHEKERKLKLAQLSEDK